MSTDLTDRWRKELADWKQKLIDGLAAGGANDYAEYRERVGNIATVREAEHRFTELVTRLTEDDECRVND